MKLQLYLILTHFCTATVTGALFATALLLDESWGLTIAPSLAAAGALGASTLAARKLSRGLKGIEQAIHDYNPPQPTGIAEFDALNTSLAEDAKHWESIAADTRSQTREFQNMITMLDRRSKGAPSSMHLRSILNGLGATLHSHLNQLQEEAEEVEQIAKSITDGAESQGHAVIKTTAYIEQLSSTIDNVSSNAASAQNVMQQTERTAMAALEHMQELSQGMRLVHSESLTCEKNMRALCDPTRQISAIVESIGDIASRTDLLALNASIESIRAGEHGRGFAVVAEEVRKLSEQATDATREINSLLDSMQLVTQESIRGIMREREQVEAGVRRAEQAEQSLKEIGQLGHEVRSLEQISESAMQQLQLAQDVVVAVEQISGLAKSNRSNAENAGWTMKSLTNSNPQIDNVVRRLQDCGQGLPQTEPRSDAHADDVEVQPELQPAS
ncbi:MAG: methyl-accepting chemotaxis protein [Planctomycetota bacterium]|nr:methyl-accepting chemotaxis protein [Planctomycetota bacterium]